MIWSIISAAFIGVNWRNSTGSLYNGLLLIVLGAVTSISLNNVDKALISAFNLNHGGHLTVVLILSALIVIAVAGVVYWQRFSGSRNH